MNLGMRSKGPDDVLPYDVDLDRWLEDSDRVVDATASAEGGELVINQVLASDRAVRIWLQGGREGETSTVRIHVTTFAGLIKEFCLHIRISRC